ncbi:hypothetical protein SEEN4881_05650 [Salmonella enterica subsp. enterica serovar Newport str. WA_14881]|nr:hypothetical protein SEEN4881_05650 [Salmonella enterica subsp. enterica serovar Newport str. WA_14881]
MRGDKGEQKMIPIISKTITATMAVNIHDGNMPKTSSIM